MSAADAPSSNGMMPTLQATNPEVDPDHITCLICSENYDPSHGKEPVITYCGHVFCQQCIDIWHATSSNRDCPACRKPQVHECQHRCQPRPLHHHPPLAARADDRELRPSCVACVGNGATLSAWEILEDVVGDPDLEGNYIMREESQKRQRDLEHLRDMGPGDSDERQSAQRRIDERWQRAVDRCWETWLETLPSRRW